MSTASNPKKYKTALTLPGERGLPERDREAIASVRAEILDAGIEWRERHPFLTKHQDAVGLAIFLVCTGGFLATGALFLAGAIAWWVSIPAGALFLSILHELEHDLIHFMYFRRRPWVMNAMMLGVWLQRPSSVNPWSRRRMHLHHHRASGTESDLEEQAITNGEKWGLRRLLMTSDGRLSVWLRPLRTRQMVIAFIKSQAPESKAEQRSLFRQQMLSYTPLGDIHYTLLHVWIGTYLVLGISQLLGSPITLGATYSDVFSVITALVVVWFAPNALRSFCLYFVSSNMHYFGDVEEGNVMQQTQVWTAWWLAPLHLFCFNFGSTHAIHHFVVGDPFYIRQAIAGPAHNTLRDHGVRFNDFGTFKRANRRGPEPAHI